MTWFYEGDESPAVPLAASLERLTAKIGSPSPSAISTIFGSWDDVVGAQIAVHAQPRHLSGGILTVIVEDARWVNQLRWLKSQLIERLNAAIQAEVIHDVHVRVDTSAFQHDDR